MSINQILTVVVMALILALLIVLGWRGPSLLQPTAGNEARVDGDCDLHRGACEAHWPDGTQLTFAITPRPIRMQQRLQLHAEVTGPTPPERVQVDFQGVEMYMGYNRPELERRDGRWQSLGILPLCVADQMTWEATVMLHRGEADEDLYTARFRFLTRRDDAGDLPADALDRE
ncbi:hypothetical protein ACN2MM_09825 [Alkalilimnicola ehrlichii MLHE-1]|uniref:Uncharacterized protein n=1 Tax=Alkalilimnicola ehrlichii (strain ATCC BAA-1101 / DSM 17681 / MLHE-1) TaxID=187272 RepID=Q0A7M7_ALKEH|nr:hypothetical protein [Alkalilimnicola ehrlichii]ABI57160.1 hypothetical protein Mlg_1816 [Alkalilimnicola ehrlichii MLHE-1]